MEISELLSLENTIAGELFAGLSYPWQALEPVSYTHLDVYKRQIETPFYSLFLWIEL